MLFNLLLCEDLVGGYKRKHTPPSRVMKVDLHKAFDSVHCDFIKELLNALKFPPLFTQWIIKCITPVQFIISINGQQGAPFKGKR